MNPRTDIVGSNSYYFSFTEKSSVYKIFISLIYLQVYMKISRIFSFRCKIFFVDLYAFCKITNNNLTKLQRLGKRRLRKWSKQLIKTKTDRCVSLQIRNICLSISKYSNVEATSIKFLFSSFYLLLAYLTSVITNYIL